MIQQTYHTQILLLLTLIGFSSVPNAQEIENIKTCSHNGEWPPYIYFKKENGVIDKSQVQGATIELFNEIFRRMELTYSMDMIPWVRCLQEVHTFGKNKRYEFFFNASYSEERASKYYITSPLYITNQGLFYSTKRFTSPPKIDSPSDLEGYTLCGILGYNYTMYRELGVMNTIDTGAKGLSTVLKKIANERCDFFPSPMEPILAGKKLGVYNYSDVIGVIHIPWAGTTGFHAYIAKTSPRAFELYTKINHHLQILKNTGEADKIFKKWLTDGDGL